MMVVSILPALIRKFTTRGQRVILQCLNLLLYNGASASRQSEIWPGCWRRKPNHPHRPVSAFENQSLPQTFTTAGLLRPHINWLLTWNRVGSNTVSHCCLTGTGHLCFSFPHLPTVPSFATSFGLRAASSQWRCTGSGEHLHMKFPMQPLPAISFPEWHTLTICLYTPYLTRHMC